MSSAVLLMLLLSAADRCDPGPARDPADPAAAEVYLAVGEEELARGAWEAARIAFGEARRADPENAKARAAWLSVCRGPPEDGFTAGLRQMRAGDCAAAIQSFAAARAVAPDPAAALLQGICHYELREDRLARAALQEAHGEPELRAQAQLYLGLLAAREGHAREAGALLEPLTGSNDPALSTAAYEALRRANEDARLLVTGALQVEADSNPYIVPDRIGRFADEAGAATLGLVFRPLGASGPYARAHGLYRNQLATDVFDTFALGAGAGWQLLGPTHRLFAEGGVDRMTLGNSPYLLAWRGELGAGWSASQYSLLGSYQFRSEEVSLAGLEGYSGVTHAAVLWGQRAAGNAVWSLGYSVYRSDTVDPVLEHVEHGPRVQLRLRAWDRGRLRFEGAWLWRPYDHFDPLLGTRRDDTLLDLVGSLEISVNQAMELRFDVRMQRSQSTVDSFDYTRVLGGVALSFTAVPW